MLRFLPRQPAPPPSEDELAALLPFEGVTARLLYARGVRDAKHAEAFLHPDASALHDPFLLQDMDKAVALLRAARDDGARVCVYGDYDVDGVCATALLCEALLRFGVDASARTPLRDDGYGLHLSAVERMAAEGVSLLVTVDLGITNHEQVARARELGMRVIVTDHHQPGLAPCPADAVLNPLLGDYPYPRLCGTGVAFKLAQALLGEGALDDLDLVALATVADVVPLTGENRVLTALGLASITEGARVGIAALKEVSGCKAEADAYALGFQLGPRLNAAGRLGDASVGVRLLRCTDRDEARELARRLDEENEKRRELERQMLKQARQQLAGHDYAADPLLWAQGDDWHAGVIGLVAGRLCQEGALPSIALSREGDTLRGSLRSVPGVNIHQCLVQCDDLLLRYGGHEQAAGVTLAPENADAFRARLREAIRLCAPPDAFEPFQPYDLPLPLAECDEALARALTRLAPFGMGNPAPLFMAQGLALERRHPCGAEQAHLQLTLRQGARVLDGIGFGMGALATTLPDTVDAVFALRINEWMGRVSVQCDCKALRPASGAEDKRALVLPLESAQDALLDALAALATPPQAGKEAADAEIEYLPAAEPEALPDIGRGTLLVARAPETASALLHAQPGRIELCVGGAPSDPRCPATLWLAPGAGCRTQGRYREIVLLDGALSPDEPAHWQSAYPGARVRVLPRSGALCALAQGADAGDDRYRALYRLLRGGVYPSLAALASAAGLKTAQARLGLEAFSQLGLAQYAKSPFRCALLPPKPCALHDAPLLRALRLLARPSPEVTEC